MPDDFGTIVSDIVSETRRSMSDVISNLVLDAIAHYQSDRFFFNETTQSFSISSSQDTYTSVDASFIPRVMEIDSMRLTVSSSDQPTLDPVQWSYLEDLNYPTSNGQPVAYAYWGQSFRFYPIPDGGYAVRFSGVTQDTSLSLSTDINNWTTRGKGYELIKNRAKSLLYSEWLRDDVNAGRALARERQAYDQLKLRTSRSHATGSITPCL